MDHVNYFRVLFESDTDYRKTVLILFSIKNDIYLKKESGFSRNDINGICLEFKSMLMEQNEEYLIYIQKEKEYFIEKVINK